MGHNYNNFNFHGYDAYHIVRNNKKGGGVACNVKQELTSKCLFSKSMVVDDVFECTTIEIQVSGNTHFIVSWYIGPGFRCDSYFLIYHYISQFFYVVTST